MTKKYRSKTSRGFSLIELMAVVSVLAILVATAAPAMRKTLADTRLRTEASRLMMAINLARSEAIGRNIPVSMCPSTYGSNGVARCSRSYGDGWIVFTNLDRDRVVDAGSDEIVKVFEGLPVGYTLTNKSGNRSAFEVISYYPDGSSRRNRTLMICPPGDSKMQSWSVVMNRVGRPRIAKGWGECS